MINRVIHSNAAAVAVRNAAELRRNQPSSSSSATQQPGAQYNFAEIFGGDNWGATAAAAKPPSVITVPSHGGFDTAIATATVTNKASQGAEPAASTASTDIAAKIITTAATTANAPATNTATTVSTPGIGALVTAIMNGSFKPTYVTDPSQLKEINPAGTATMPNFYYASDQTAAQLAQLLGGTVVKMPPFGQDRGWTEPSANFIKLPNGQTFNAADVAYYANAAPQGAAQLTADITGTINQGSAWTNYYQQGGQMPTFAMGYVGPAITGMSYPTGSIGADGNVINPAIQQSGT